MPCLPHARGERNKPTGGRPWACSSPPSAIFALPPRVVNAVRHAREPGLVPLELSLLRVRRVLARPQEQVIDLAAAGLLLVPPDQPPGRLGAVDLAALAAGVRGVELPRLAVDLQDVDRQRLLQTFHLLFAQLGQLLPLLLQRLLLAAQPPQLVLGGAEQAAQPQPLALQAGVGGAEFLGR